MLYLVFATTMFFWGGTDALLARTELITPEANVFGVQTYNELSTTHGVTMIFLFVTPMWFGFANYLIPLLIGADDMAFPRLNAIGFWLLPPAAVLVRFGIISNTAALLLAPLSPGLSTLLTGFEPINAAWTFYPPLSAEDANPQMDLALLGLHLSGISTTIGAINVIATIVVERAPDVGWERLDIFSWTQLTASGIILFVFPLLGAVFIMLLLDRNVGTAFFAVEHGGPILYQHLFWFWGHPEVLREKALRVQVRRLLHVGDRCALVRRLGAPHVHDGDRPPNQGSVHGRDDRHRRTLGSKGLQLDYDDVGW